MTERAETRQQTTSSGAGGAADAGAGGADRRRNPRLRELVDEMLASVRVAARRDLWTEEERKQYESELADIMRRVRFEAVWKGGPKADGRGAAGDSA